MNIEKPVYKQLKQLVINEMGISREVIQDLLRDMVASVAKDVFTHIMDTNKQRYNFDQLVKQAVADAIKSRFNWNAEVKITVNEKTEEKK